MKKLEVELSSENLRNKLVGLLIMLSIYFVISIITTPTPNFMFLVVDLIFLITMFTVVGILMRELLLYKLVKKTLEDYE